MKAGFPIWFGTVVTKINAVEALSCRGFQQIHATKRRRIDFGVVSLRDIDVRGVTVQESVLPNCCLNDATVSRRLNPIGFHHSGTIRNYGINL